MSETSVPVAVAYPARDSLPFTTSAYSLPPRVRAAEKAPALVAVGISVHLFGESVLMFTRASTYNGLLVLPALALFVGYGLSLSGGILSMYWHRPWPSAGVGVAASIIGIASAAFAYALQSWCSASTDGLLPGAVANYVFTGIFWAAISGILTLAALDAQGNDVPVHRREIWAIVCAIGLVFLSRATDTFHAASTVWCADETVFPTADGPRCFGSILAGLGMLTSAVVLIFATSVSMIRVVDETVSSSFIGRSIMVPGPGAQETRTASTSIGESFTAEVPSAGLPVFGGAVSLPLMADSSTSADWPEAEERGESGQKPS